MGKQVHFGTFTVVFVLCIVTSQCFIVSFTMVEEEPIGYPVGSVLEQSRAILNVSDISRLTFRILPNEYDTMFTMNDSNGTIFTAVELDRETVCSLEVICILEFKVTVLNSGQFLDQIVVQINVEDMNDNEPHFPSDKITIDVPEDSAVGETFRIDSATDDDYGGNNSIQGYELVTNEQSQGVFGLLTHKNDLDGTFSLKITVEADLDRETKDAYEVKVIARDGGDPPFSDILTVSIKITDVNDNSPTFTQNLYNVTIDERTPIRKKILTLNATDADTGENGRIVYRVSNRQSNTDQINELFEINPDSGDILVKSDLTYLAGESFRFIVIAVDSGDDPNEDQTEVQVNIRDTINNNPKVTAILQSQGNTGFVNISESSGLNTYVAHIIVEDTDTGLNGEITCSVSDSHFGIKTVTEGSSYIVEVRGVLDYEVQRVHNLTVTCSDQGSPSLSGTANFLVRVTDKNDNKPVFDKSSYTARLRENNDGNEVLTQVSADDSDSGQNAVIHYEMHGDGLERFTVDRTTGVVSVTTVLDREVTDVIRFHVLAVDNGFPSLTGTTEFILIVEDVNDQTPEFNKTVHAMTVEENQLENTHVGYLHASDGDVGRNAEFDFSIKDSDSSQVPFTVFASGEIKCNRQLNREQRSRYDFTVVVTDRGEPALSSSAHVTVFVIDVNDNAPNVTFPRSGNNSVSLWYPEYQSSYVTTIRAYDVDQGVNQELSFAIRAGNELGIFAIDESSGDLYFTSQVDIKADITVTLTISVSDNGEPRLVSLAELVVELKYTNATYMETPTEEDSTYIVIAVVVVIVTLLVSGGLIALILFLRTLDRKRKEKSVEDNTNTDSDFGFSEGQVNTTLTIDGVTSESNDHDVGVLKKKEVSFILDNGDTTDHYQQQFSGSLPRLDKPTKSLLRSSSTSDRPSTLDTLELQEKANTQLHTMKLQQMMLQNRAKQWVQQQQQQQQFGSTSPPHHHDDHQSETSGETIGSDSGRGCSEEDDVHSSPSADDPKTFDLVNPQTRIPYSPPPQTVTRTDSLNDRYNSTNYKPQYGRQPWTRKSHLANRDFHSSHSNTRLPVTNYQNALVDSYRDSRPYSGRVSYPNSYYPQISPMDFTGDSALHSFFDKTPVGYSRDDDECSTTTSGSYTLYSEEIL